MTSEIDKVRDWTPWVGAVLLPALVFSGLGIRQDFRSRAVFEEASEISQSFGGEPVDSVIGFQNSRVRIEETLAAVAEVQEVLAREDAIPSSGDVLEDLAYILNEISAIRNALESTPATSNATESLSELAQTAAFVLESDESARVQQLEAELAELVQGQAVRPIGPGVYGIYFGFNSSDISFPARIAMASVVSREAPSNNDVLRIVGFADRSGSESQNCELARRRVEAVAELVESLGLEFDTERTVLGETGVPVDPDIDGKREPANRLVMLIFPNGESPSELTLCAEEV